MKKSIAILLAAAVSVAAFAGPPKPAAPKTTIHCAVMHEDEVKIADAVKAKHFADYKGNRYYFCCPDCQAAFKKNPAKYAKSEHTPIPKV